jgi:hypothetical protein
VFFAKVSKSDTYLCILQQWVYMSVQYNHAQYNI